VRRLTSLLGRKVVTESGLALGRCYDLRGAVTGSSLRVRSLCVGRRALAERFGVAGHDRHHEVAWSSIVRFERDRIVVRDP
jgi:sporulation protein YlmC with PRC-barrel domain